MSQSKASKQSALNTFITKQIDHISSNPWSVIQRKLKRLFLLPVELAWLILAFPLVILIRVLHPVLTIRIGMVDLGRIGGIMQGDWYLSEKACGKHPNRHYDLFYFCKSTHHVNRQWEKMWRRALHYVPFTKLWEKVILLNRLFPEHDKHEVSNHHVFPNLKTWQEHLRHPKQDKLRNFNERMEAVLKNKKANIAFNPKEERYCQSLLEGLGINKDKHYICFHARCPAFLEMALETMDWSYHNYRDSSIHNYIQAAEEMANRGYYAIRMGAVVKENIQSSNPRIIDYATSGQRTDFNDIYLGSHCRFFLCSDGGMSAIPEMFRIPTVYVNWAPILGISTWVLNGLFIFKKFYLKNEKRFMTFYEIMNIDFFSKDTNEIFEKLNLELIENTHEEISAVTIEMDERLNGTWQISEEDEKLQESFWALFGPDKLKSPDLLVGAEYLRQNKHLLI